MPKQNLQDRINQSMGTDKGVSLVPDYAGKPKPPKPEKDKAPLLEEYLDDTNLIHEMESCVETYDALSEQIKTLESRKKAMRDEIENILGNCGIESARVLGTYTVSRFEQDRATLRKDLLLSAGVSMQTISACTEISKVVTIKVTREKAR